MRKVIFGFAVLFSSTISVQSLNPLVTAYLDVAANYGTQPVQDGFVTARVSCGPQHLGTWTDYYSAGLMRNGIARLRFDNVFWPDWNSGETWTEVHARINGVAHYGEYHVEFGGRPRPGRLSHDFPPSLIDMF